MSDNARKFWENCDTTFAHITADRWLKNKETLTNSFKGKLGDIDPTGKVIIDYGIGAAHLGMYLLENCEIEKYIGIDIAQRSLDAAAKNLSKYNNVDLKLAPVDFSTLNADVLASFAVVQHFPTQEYLDSFLENINKSGIKELAIQIRHGKETKFSNNYETQDGVKLSCITNATYMLTKLTNYEVTKIGDVIRNNYQYIYFKRK